MLTASDIRMFLHLTDDETDSSFMSDDVLNVYIEQYTNKIIDYVGPDIDQTKMLESPLFNEALLSGIACHLSMLNPELLYSPTEYEVGNTKEKYSDAILNKTPTWCSRYNSALEDLLDSLNEIKNLRTFRRRGLSSNRRYHHDI